MTRRRALVALSVTLPGLGFVLSACGPTFPGATVAQQLTGWAHSTGFTAQVTLIQGDLARIDRLTPRRDPGTLRTDCDVLVTDTLAANQNLPTPDQTLTDRLSTAYGAAGLAGHDCFSGAGGSTPFLTRSTSLRVTARRDLIRALARYDAVTTGLAGGTVTGSRP